jgi:GMP synthase (glutamine-hydrolysing)
MASSAATTNQAFQHGKRVFGMQFHLECTAEALADLANAGVDELVPAQWVQSADEVLNQPVLVGTSEELMGAFLDGVAESAG